MWSLHGGPVTYSRFILQSVLSLDSTFMVAVRVVGGGGFINFGL